MNEMLNEIVEEQTMDNVAEGIADVEISTSGFGKKVVVTALVVGAVVGTVTLYKKVIKPKLAARKAKKDNVIDTEATEEASE